MNFAGSTKSLFLRPVVRFPVANEFNQVVCIDLKEVQKGKLWFLHMIDGATRYTAASLISTKKKEAVVEKIFQCWIAYLGAPKRLHSDCGGEFTNNVMIEMSEKLGIETSTTAGEAPFSNGLVERSNKILYESMMKTMQDTKCDMSTALAWAVSAKNCLQNVNGYAPNQLVFGINANMPSVVTDKPPALEQTQSDLIRNKLSTIHSARQNFIKAESSERIKRALRHQVRTYSEEVYLQGDKVYFKQNDNRGWKGPGVVLGVERNFVLIREGSRFYRCHPCQLMKVNPTVKGGDDSTNNPSSAANETNVDSAATNVQKVKPKPIDTASSTSKRSSQNSKKSGKVDYGISLEDTDDSDDDSVVNEAGIKTVNQEAETVNQEPANLNQEAVIVDDEVETVNDTVTDVTGIVNDFTEIVNETATTSQKPVQNQDTSIVEAGVDDIP